MSNVLESNYEYSFLSSSRLCSEKGRRSLFYCDHSCGNSKRIKLDGYSLLLSVNMMEKYPFRQNIQLMMTAGKAVSSCCI